MPFENLKILEAFCWSEQSLWKCVRAGTGLDRSERSAVEGACLSCSQPLCDNGRHLRAHTPRSIVSLRAALPAISWQLATLHYNMQAGSQRNNSKNDAQRNTSRNAAVVWTMFWEAPQSENRTNIPQTTELLRHTCLGLFNDNVQLHRFWLLCYSVGINGKGYVKRRSWPNFKTLYHKREEEPKKTTENISQNILCPDIGCNRKQDLWMTKQG